MYEACPFHTPADCAAHSQRALTAMAGVLLHLNSMQSRQNKEPAGSTGPGPPEPCTDHRGAQAAVQGPLKETLQVAANLNSSGA